MTALNFILADPTRHRDPLLELNVEYMCWNAGEIEKVYGLSIPELFGMPVAEYVSRVIHKVCGDPPPAGSFYLVELDGQVAGMGGMRRIREGVCELKRVYVRPAHRGRRVGDAIIERAIADAVAFGYATMVLDSGPFMQSAHRLYAAAGFVDRAPYPESEVPAILREGWRFMTLQLGARGTTA